MRQHTGEKPLQCNACKFTARDPSVLKKHQMRHEKVRFSFITKSFSNLRYWFVADKEAQMYEMQLRFDTNIWTQASYSPLSPRRTQKYLMQYL